MAFGNVRKSTVSLEFPRKLGDLNTVLERVERENRSELVNFRISEPNSLLKEVMSRSILFRKAWHLRQSVSPRRFLYHDPDHDHIEDASVQDRRILYEHHIPTTLAQKALLALGTTIGGLMNPARGEVPRVAQCSTDFIAVNGETTGMFALRAMHKKMLDDDEGRQILMDRPRINTTHVDYDRLRKLDKSTLGATYVDFLDRHNLDPDGRLPVRYVDDDELSYVMQRYRDIHDVTHAVFGMDVKLLGEVAIKWIEGIQTGLPMCLGGALLAPLRFRPKTRQKYVSEVLPWALENGFKSKLLLNAYFEKRWEQNVGDFRREFCITEFPGSTSIFVFVSSVPFPFSAIMADVSAKVVAQTQEALGKYVKKPPLSEKLLKKPPFRFLHDVVKAVMVETGFFDGLYTPDELNSDLVKEKEAKIAFLQKAINVLSIATGETIAAKPSKIVAGHEVEKTNEFLQALGKALSKKVEFDVKSINPKYVTSSKDAVARVLAGEKPGEKKKATKDKPAAKETGKEKAGAKPTAKPKPEDEKKKRPTVAHVKSKEKKPVNEKSKKPLAKSKESPVRESLAAKTSLDSPLEEVNGGIMGFGDTVPSSPSHIGQIPGDEDVETFGVVEKAIDELNAISGSQSNIEVTEEYQPNEQSLVNSDEVAFDDFRTEPERPTTSKAETFSLDAVFEDPALEPEAPSRISLRTAGERPQSRVHPTFIEEEAPVASRNAPKTAAPSRPVSRINTGVSRAASSRPRTGRPVSARPAPPRVRDKNEFVEDQSLHRPQTGRVANVMLVSAEKEEEDEDDNFVVQENGGDTGSEIAGLLSGDILSGQVEGEHGALVSQILATKTEMETQAGPGRSVEIVSFLNQVDVVRCTEMRIFLENCTQEKAEGAEATGFGAREREATSRDIASTQKAVQGLTRIANPLAHLMEYLQEDVEAMNKELEHWINEKNQCNQILKMQQREMDQGTEPLKTVLQELESSIVDQLDKISAIKASILRNEERIHRLLKSTGSSMAYQDGAGWGSQGGYQSHGGYGGGFGGGQMSGGGGGGGGGGSGYGNPGGMNKQTLTIPSSSVGRLIGRGGSKIRELQDTTNCQIKVVQGDAAGPGSTFVDVSYNNDDDFEHASSLIRQVTEETDAGRYQPRGGGGGGGGGGGNSYGGQAFSAAIPDNCVGLIIGKGGARIKEIENRVGCSVRVKNDGNGSHFAEVQGSEEQYKQVQDIINETVERQRNRQQY
ncbi:unnamed protein product [Notodromas monacha]|uniref:Ubiquinone biosynthesis protein COQ4 homolog, mitochondrial n=1 Tax=Notodromas monacha TaxID=399045 RepID=A0A7R9BNG8_9CRUS|nr:unnamed protein product [Notodromas monacha]CAG0918717.1 unnamed protein product [Notodromas monacha]